MKWGGRASLEQIAVKLGRVTHTSKGPTFYKQYEPYFSPLEQQPVRMLELGVHAGDSLKVFSTFFQKGRVVGMDIAAPEADFSEFKNAVFELGDQRDSERLKSLSARYAPDGWDIILDDASHYGSWSQLSFTALIPQLKPGGLYVVEDWDSGYWDDWPDGRRFQSFHVDVPEGHIPPRVPSHDAGMVGFVKSLIDELVDRPVGDRLAPTGYHRMFDWIHFNPTFAILKKIDA